MDFTSRLDTPNLRKSLASGWVAAWGNMIDGAYQYLETAPCVVLPRHPDPAHRARHQLYGRRLARCARSLQLKTCVKKMGTKARNARSFSPSG